MPNEWISYMHKFDDLMQDALLACSKNSLQNMFSALHGDGTMGPSNLLKVDIDLKNNKVRTTFFLNDFNVFGCNFKLFTFSLFLRKLFSIRPFFE